MASKEQGPAACRGSRKNYLPNELTSRSIAEGWSVGKKSRVHIRGFSSALFLALAVVLAPAKLNEFVLSSESMVLLFGGKVSFFFVNILFLGVAQCC